ncbi:uncharacterized protein JCM6883_002329 [Sporobolomyces salmoneus]|uniref:uncharacterized protein n=1 Tax=Sporobolomyces salmoneus TaxID=183962 RepID=UPI00316B78D7
MAPSAEAVSSGGAQGSSLAAYEQIASSTLRFFLNGSPVTLEGNTFDPDTSLLSFIRSQPNLKGTKLGCGEGGCGACIVVLQAKHPKSGKITHSSINSCLTPLVAVDGKHVITVEALGDEYNPHPLQERMAKLSGSQCGFCTPGIIMSVYALLREAAYQGKLTVTDVELGGALDSNLCRCTGYAPIFRAVKSFVGEYLAPKENGACVVDRDFVVPLNYKDSGLEPERIAEGKAGCCKGTNPAAEKAEEVSTDVSLPAETVLDSPVPKIDPVNTSTIGRTAPVDPQDQDMTSSAQVKAGTKPKGCGRADCCQLGGDPSKGESTAATVSFPKFTFKPYRPGTELIYPPGLAKHQFVPLKFGSATRNWYRPTSLEQLIDLKRALPDAKVVGGSSELAIEVSIKGALYPACIYVGDLPQAYDFTLPNLDDDEPVFSFSANLTLSELETILATLVAKLPREQTGPLRAMKEQLHLFAGKSVRNAATVAGNIATASPISDLNPVWLATRSRLTAISSTNAEPMTLQLDDFFTGYRQTRLPKDAVISKIEVPLFKPKREGEKEIVRAYKQSKRRDDDIAIVTACFASRLDKDNKFLSIKLAFGGMAAFTVAAKKTEEFILGKTVSSSTLQGAIDILADEFNLPFTVPGGMASFRRTLALSFLFKYFVEIASQCGVSLDKIEGVSPSEKANITEIIKREPQTSKRDNSDPYAKEIVGKQEPHSSALNHTTGSATYVDDLPTFQHETYLALVLSSRAHARILNVDRSAALEMPNVLTYVDHTDLPSPKANCWGPAVQDEFFFAVDEVTSHGGIIGAIVATNKIDAQKAARAVKIEYEDLPRILTIEEALAANSFHESYNRRIARGDKIEDALAASEFVLEGRTTMQGQEHFFLETFACLVVPKNEAGEIEIFASSQSLTETQHTAAQVTGVPRNRIVARSKRLGGGFGGKESRTSMLSSVCAVAARKVKRPVRCMLDRSEDIKISGQRHPFLAEWKVGFTKDGKLTALDVMGYANGGYSLDLSGGVTDRFLAHLDNCYYIPHMDVRGRVVKTNTVSNTAFRGFGAPQGMLVAENYIEAIAHKLNLDIDHVRQINLYAEGQKTHYHQKVLDYHVPRMLQQLKQDVDFEKRKKEVEQFNRENKWRKKGLSLLPTKFGLAFGVKAMNQGSALVHIYLDGSVSVSHGGIEMGQGLYIKCLQVAAQELKVPLEAVFTSETGSNTVINTSPTAASAGSDLNGFAVHNACVELNKRLAPFREKLGPDATMSALAAAAYGERISLSATGHHATPDLGYVWNCMEETGKLFDYYTQGVCYAEVELDVLDGSHKTTRLDIIMDVGRSLNPNIDYGQIEGAVVQGMGWSTIEESLWLQNGAIFTTGPGAYKIPGFNDIPEHLSVKLLRDAEWPTMTTIHSSKGIGEPPFFLGTSVSLALRQALLSSRKDGGFTKDEQLVPFNWPMTSERLRNESGDWIAKKGRVEPKEGEKGKEWFVRLA